MNMNLVETAVLYTRFSSHGQNEQSIEAQIRICKEFAESKSLKVINVYSDKARTGTNDSRPAFQQMINDAKSGAFKYIIVYMFDRFARNRRDSIMYKEMLKEKYGIRVLSALEPIAEDEGGEFYEMFLDWNAEKYSKRLSKRVRDGLDISVANGTYCGGTLIFGYKIENEPIPNKPNKFIKRVVLDEENAKLVKFAFEEYAKGKTKKEIADELNEQGYRIKNKKFIGKSFDKWLVNRKYTGEFVFGGRKCDNMYPAIVSKEIFDKVEKRLNANRYFAGGVATAKVPYLLTGKIFCGHCGTAMVADGGTSKTGVKHHYYSCKKMKKRLCTKHREHKDHIELYVVENIREFLSDDKNAQIVVKDVLAYYDKRTDEENLKSIVAKIAKAKKEVDDLADAFVKAKSRLLQESIENKMNEYEILLNDLQKQKAMLELERGYKLTEKDLLGFIVEILKGDPNDKNYQRKLVDHLVYQVYVRDDYTTVFLAISGNKTIEELSFEDYQSSTKATQGVQTQLPLARQSEPKPNTRLRFIFFKKKISYFCLSFLFVDALPLVCFSSFIFSFTIFARLTCPCLNIFSC